MKRPVDIGLVPEPNLEEVGVQSDKALRAAPFLYGPVAVAVSKLHKDV
jgi:hypothetical protein